MAAGERPLERLIEERLLGNGHRCRVQLVPRPGMAAALAEEEAAELAATRATMDEAAVARVAQEAAELKAMQAQQQQQQQHSTTPLETRRRLLR